MTVVSEDSVTVIDVLVLRVNRHSHVCMCYRNALVTVRWNKGRVEKNPTQYWTLSGVSRIYKHCIKL